VARRQVFAVETAAFADRPMTLLIFLDPTGLKTLGLFFSADSWDS
jgi:hypothetical protein